MNLVLELSIIQYELTMIRNEPIHDVSQSEYWWLAYISRQEFRKCKHSMSRVWPGLPRRVGAVLTVKSHLMAGIAWQWGIGASELRKSPSILATCPQEFNFVVPERGQFSFESFRQVSAGEFFFVHIKYFFGVSNFIGTWAVISHC